MREMSDRKLRTAIDDWRTNRAEPTDPEVWQGAGTFVRIVAGVCVVLWLLIIRELMK